jgi:hypothetical protein
VAGLLAPLCDGYVCLVIFDGHDHVPVLVVAEHPGAHGLQPAERLRGGVAVGVVLADLNDGYLGGEPVEEEGRGGSVGAVVSDLEDRPPAGVGAVADVLLSLLLGVASEEDAGRVEGQEYADRVIVSLGEDFAAT